MKTSFVLAAVFILGGCSTSSPKNSMTLDAVIDNLRASIHRAQEQCKEVPDSCHSGLQLSESEVTLVLTTTAAQSGEVSTPPVLGVVFKGGSSSSKENTSTIRLKFTRPEAAKEGDPSSSCSSPFRWPGSCKSDSEDNRLLWNPGKSASA